jgi:hypothetical protein
MLGSPRPVRRCGPVTDSSETDVSPLIDDAAKAHEGLVLSLSDERPALRGERRRGSSPSVVTDIARRGSITRKHLPPDLQSLPDFQRGPGTGQYQHIWPPARGVHERYKPGHDRLC